jgi:hypothetical protein
VQSSSPSQCSNQILGDHRIVTSWTKALKVSFRPNPAGRQYALILTNRNRGRPWPPVHAPSLQ